VGEADGVIVVFTTFKLKPGADREAFLAADKHMQEEVFHQMKTFIRRTVAYNAEHDEWIAVLFFWDNGEDLEMHSDAFASHPLVQATSEFVDADSIVGRSYTDIGG
jgi:hypothetical protein